MKKRAGYGRLCDLETAKQRLAKMNVYGDVNYNEMEDETASLSCS